MDRAEARTEARRVWSAVEARWYEPATGLYAARTGPLRRRRAYEHLWPFAGAWSALCALASLGAAEISRARLDRQLVGLERYRRWAEPTGGLSSSVVPPLGPGGEVYFDDNAWIGLALCRHARLTGDPRPVALAAGLADHCASGWVADAHLAHPGGIRWREGLVPGSRNTCANGPVVELAAVLALHGGGPDRVELAVRVYEWTRATLRTQRGLYADRIAPDGRVTSAVLSYNQGTMIGAGVLLHELTGEARYLDDATETGAAALERYGEGTALSKEPPGLVAIFLRNLLLLDTIRPERAAWTLAEAYAEGLLHARDPAGLVQPRAGPAGSPLLSSSALVEVLCLLAGAWPAP